MQFLNVFFFVFHTCWVIFNSVGWIWKQTRKWHLVTIAVTAFCWFVLGFWYGWGFCPCTEWHWQIRSRMGYHDPDSYMQLLFDKILGLHLPAILVDSITVGVFILTIILSIWLNIKDYLKQKSHAKKLI
jgi:hypothetical protein